MPKTSGTHYFKGIVEGFYGKPWIFRYRSHLLRNLAEWKLNTYIYAPKFDPLHRNSWQELYSESKLREFQILAQFAEQNDLTFVYAISPGLSMQLTDPDQIKILTRKLKQLQSAGIRHFGLFLDDIPENDIDGSQQARLANMLAEELDDPSLFFCPTIYSDMHIRNFPDSRNYLNALKTNLLPEIGVFWTGPTIISRNITVSDANRFAELIGRAPLIWDNYLNNDYVPASALFSGPIMGRDPVLPRKTAGYFLNPSRDYHLSIPPMISVGAYLDHPEMYAAESHWRATISRLFPGNHKLMEYILGYFFTPFAVSSDWQRRLSELTDYLKGTSVAAPPIEKEFEEGARMLHSEENLIRFGAWWEELFPFVQTLHGDIRYILHIIKRKKRKTDLFKPRDPRWSTPLYHRLISLLFPPGGVR